MKTKIFTSFILTALLLTSFVSALEITTVFEDFDNPAESQNFTLTDFDSETTEVIFEDNPQFTIGSNTFDFIITPQSPYTISDPLGSETFTISLVQDPNDYDFGIYEIPTNFDFEERNSSEGTVGTALDDATLTVRSGFCSDGPVSNVDDVDIDLDEINIDVKIDNRGEGTDDEWELLDRIEVEVTVDNGGEDDFDDVIVVLGLFDEDGKDLADELIYEEGDEEIDVGDIKDGKDEEVTFRFKTPADFDEGNYRLAVKAYSDKEDEDHICSDIIDSDNELFETIKIERITDEERSIVVDDIVLDSNEATCGDQVTGTFTVFNAGDDDQDKVKIELKNELLGVDESFEVVNLDSGDDQDVQFSFVIPNNAEDRFHTLEFRTFFDYKNGNYRKVSENMFPFTVQVIGCDVVPLATENKVVISASLDSEAKSGEELVVKSSVTNTGDEAVTLTVNAQGHESWASLQSVSPGVLVLSPGQTGEVTFKFNVNEETSGSETFIIETKNALDGLTAELREVEVNIKKDEKKMSGFNTELLEGNSLIWVIAAVNVILIVLIILVAVRLSRR